MEIILKNIGVISESSIVLDGLTVITGKNGTGKTTVGKAVYSLIDAVSDLQSKAEADRKMYVQDKLNALNNLSNLYQVFQSIRRMARSEVSAQQSINDVKNPSHIREFSSFISHYPTLCEVGDDHQQILHRINSNYKLLLQQLIFELQDFQEYIRQCAEANSIELALRYFLSRYNRAYRFEKISTQDAIQSVENQVRIDLIILEGIITVIEQEADGEYAEKLIDSTLNSEFWEQIQPSGNTETSSIEIIEDNQTIFNISIQGNHVEKDCVFRVSARRAYFVDNPSVMDEYNAYISYLPRNEDSAPDSYFQPARVVGHMYRMRSLLHSRAAGTVLEQRLLDAALRPVKEKIDEIIPGSFDFSSKEEYYVNNDGTKLRISNLAAGSKMFSILKILLERGLLDENTILILDEPEIHLHPAWQNQFAELIVLLVKELKVKVLMTTHSSNFMLAIDAYMRKYGINEQVNFYQAEQLEDGFVTNRCVNDHMELFYQDFLEGFSQVKALRDYYVNR